MAFAGRDQGDRGLARADERTGPAGRHIPRIHSSQGGVGRSRVGPVRGRVGAEGSEQGERNNSVDNCLNRAAYNNSTCPRSGRLQCDTVPSKLWPNAAQPEVRMITMAINELRMTYLLLPEISHIALGRRPPPTTQHHDIHWLPPARTICPFSGQGRIVPPQKRPYHCPFRRLNADFAPRCAGRPRVASSSVHARRFTSPVHVATAAGPARALTVHWYIRPRIAAKTFQGTATSAIYNAT